MEKELRIGNIVNYYNNGWNNNHVLSSTDIVHIDYGDNAAEPIPLTEEWLLKFGFVKEKNNRPLFNGDVFRFTMFGYKVWFNVYWFEYHATGESYTAWSSYIESGSHNSSKYYDSWCYTDNVHQLQNLYFALTGKELTLSKIVLEGI